MLAIGKEMPLSSATLARHENSLSADRVAEEARNADRIA